VKDTCIPEVDDTSSETQCAAYVECMTACSKPAGC
jgi:hypothetical protein